MILRVTADGYLAWPEGRIRCALGPAGIRADKREGDGATPAGDFPLRRLLWRPDRQKPPPTGLPASPLRPEDGWCDDATHPDYNRQVRLPHPGSCETLWRDDAVYDLIVLLGHNDDPPRPGLGSAVFFHLARPGYSPTEGCVAIARADMLAVLAACDRTTRMEIVAEA